MQDQNLQIRDQADYSLKEWREKEKTALKLLAIVGELRFDRGIEIVFFRRSIYDARPSEVLNFHLLGKKYAGTQLSIDDTLLIVYRIAEIPDLAPCKVDLGKLSLEWQNQQEKYSDFQNFVNDKLHQFIDVDPKNEAAKDVVLYGFGRIGRLATRRLISMTGKGEQLRLKAIVLRPKLKDRYEEAEKRAALLQSDSVHGDFHGTVEVSPDGNELLINGNRVQLIFADRPEDIDYTKYGIKDALLIDNTGVWRDKEALSVHLRPGISKVLLTAPGKEVPNVVHGVNQGDFDFEKDNVFSAASCTTNAIAPVLKVLNDALGIDSGHVETIHAYTNDQNLLDNFHKKPRRGRGAPVNMVLTTTGAASAVAKVLPELTGKLTGNAIRVPTPNVSLAILNLNLNKKTTVEAINELLKKAALYGDLVEQIHYSNSTEYVSSNAIGMTTTSVVDAPSTIVSTDGKKATVYLWYDNEYGYTCQVVRLAKHAAKVRRYSYY
ncbi:MAG: glyceraldehyde-3-phosphate dehydrogenase [Saprospiraceae bacterium]|nr:MAG: glyceraldehyde-3-phosphate dehydrogenase [Saprospiraceae bacterium]